MNIINKKIKSFKYQWLKEFWPVPLMEDCSKGTVLEKEKAYQKNIEQRHLLVNPIINWLFLFLLGLLWLGVLERFILIGSKPNFIYIVAFLGIISCVAVAMMVIFIAAFLFLHLMNR